MMVLLVGLLDQVEHVPHESMAMPDYGGRMFEVAYQGLQLLFNHGLPAVP